VSHLFFSLVLFASTFAAAPLPTESLATSEVVEKPNSPATLRDVPYGETLVYVGHVEKAGMRFDVGRATLRAYEDEQGRPTLEARAHGAKFGYELNSRIQSILDEGTLLPAVYEVADRGTERKTKKLVFRNGGADFLRLKHCRGNDCEDPAHRVKRAKMHGPIPWGTELVHCEDRDCKHREHYAWTTRLAHEFEAPNFDLLSAIYLARQVEFSATAEPLVIPIVNDTSRWQVRVTPRGERRIEVTAGAFDAVELILEPIRSGGESKEDSGEDAKFQGLFGLNGKIRIWVDRATRRPLLIEGTLPFAFLELHAEIELERIEQAQE
jgi:hypothetical protein